MVYKYLTKQKNPKHNSATRPNYFRNKVSNVFKHVSANMYFSGPMLGYSSYILGVSIKLLLQIDCSLSYSEN